MSIISSPKTSFYRTNANNIKNIGQLELKNKILKSLNSNHNKKEEKNALFKKFIQTIQNYSNSEKEISTKFKSIVSKLFGLTIEDVEEIIKYSKHTSTGIKYFFSPFYTRSISELLNDLGFTSTIELYGSKKVTCENYLSGMNLGGMDLSNADLKSADLSSADLSGALLNGALLRFANFSRTKLSGANLSSADLSWANLSCADLSNADLNGALLRFAKLSGANLSWANLSWADLSWAYLSNADLNSANLSCANLSSADLSNADLNSALLRFAKLSRTNLSGANLSWANLSNADLSNADLSRTKLNGAKLSGADLRYAHLKGADLSGADLNGVKKLFFKFKERERDIDLFFNHLNNSGESSLTTINSISNDYLTLKIQCMEDIITQFNNSTSQIKNLVLAHSASIIDILSSTEDYFKSEIIIDFIEKNILSNEISKANTANKIFSLVEQNLFYKMALKNTQYKDFSIKNNGFIAQLIYSLKSNNNGNQKDKGIEIEALYLSNFHNLLVAVQENLNLMGSIDENSTSLLEDNMLLISQNEKHAVVVKYSYYEKFLLNKDIKDLNWDHILYFKETNENKYEIQTQDQINLDSIFNQVILFKGSYDFYCNHQKIIHVLDYINFCDNLFLFKEFLHAKNSNKKLITAGEQNKLIDTLKKFIVNNSNDENHDITKAGVEALNLKLTEEFTEKIIDIFNLQKATSIQKSQTFACLAALFTNLSSSSFFGTETESPLPLRNFAIALLNKSIEYDTNQVPNHADWKYRLAGTNNTFSCTAVLYNMMAKALKQTPVYSQIIPPAWQ